jgi:tripartite-type tricarboxylate transporter receptor subunit TctC
MHDLVGGHVDFFCEQSVSVAEQAKSGAIKAYAVSTAERLASLPDVPTAKELGVNYLMSIWAGIFAPKGTPESIIAQLNRRADKALDDDGVKQRINNLGGSIPEKRERSPPRSTPT